MPVYVYACPTHKDLEQIIVHGMTEVVDVVCPICGEICQKKPQVFAWNAPPADSGQRNAREIHGYLMEKYRANKERREANEFEYAKAQERRKKKWHEN